MSGTHLNPALNLKPGLPDSDIKTACHEDGDVVKTKSNTPESAKVLSKSMNPAFIIYLFIYLFSHLADAFVQSDLQMRAIEAIKTNKRATTCKCYDKSWLE